MKLRSPKTGIKLRDHGFFFAIRNAFKASELVMWMMSNLKLTEREALEVGQKLKDQRYIHKVKEDSNPNLRKLPSFLNTTDLYRFQEDIDPSVLNMKRIWINNSSLTAAQVVDNLRRQMLIIMEKYIYRGGKDVDYDAISKSPEFLNYQNISLQMQTVRTY
jgi:hypothetical protein